MEFKTEAAVDAVVYQMRIMDFPRGLNRALINELINGFPPYSDDEVSENNINTNVNFLEAAKITHDARRQFANAFLNPDPLFNVSLDYGPQWQRQKWSNRMTKELNKIIKGSLPYMETRRSVFAMDVAHGIGPSRWNDRQLWCPVETGIEDVLIPGKTLLSLRNLPFFAVYQQYTAQQLRRLTRGPHVDKGWNMGLVNRCIEWVDTQAQKLMYQSWPEIWSPEKMSERVKEDGGCYASDSVPTINAWDFYYWDDKGGKSGWRRRIILDSWSQPTVSHGVVSMQKENGKYGADGRSSFLYNSGDRVYAEKREQIIHFQFADGSGVAPFRYHSVRSLGFLIYSVCQLQNRLRCKFNDAVFESLMQYFRVNNMPDAERAMKVDLTDKKALPDGLEFVKAQDRWQVNEKLAQTGMELNRQSMADNSSSFTQDYGLSDKNEETATRTMAKVNSVSALVTAMLNQAYNYQKFQYDEICRRFCIPNSKDPDVRRFRLNCLKHGVPEEALNPEMWDVQPVRVIGAGNKILQVSMMDKVMSIYTKLDPSAQQEAKRMFIAVNTDDYDLAQRWVPDQPHVSDSVHDAELSAGIMLSGLPVSLKEGVNHSEYIEHLLVAMMVRVQQISGRGGVGTPDELMGLQNLAGQTIQGQPLPGNGIRAHIDLLAQDEKQPQNRGQAPDRTVMEMVKKYSDALGKMMNEVKAFAQRASEQAQKQNGNGSADAELQQQLASKALLDQTKAENSRQTNAQKQAQKQIAFEAEQARKDAQTKSEIERENVRTAAQIENDRIAADAKAKMQVDRPTEQ